MKKIIFGMLLISGGMFTSCSVTSPLTATNNEMGDKVGTSKNSCLFAFYGNANTMASASTMGLGYNVISAGTCFNNKQYGIIDAARNGGISEVATVDLKKTNYWLFTKYELIVTGK